ncbi:MAG TPA: triose-phosphate isomerase family protein [Candidatus Paceibacterota bacterium]|nr:triose-phosphate isomerase family protein [Candidatus Paceibacterota bacterium]
MLIVANWKAYIEDLEKAGKLVAASKKLARATDNRIVLAPPAPFLGAFALKNTSRIAYAAQDVSATTGGAETGETTAQTYAASGATYAIVGHSERRAAGDTNTIVAEKLAHALACDLTPILCIGEKERDHDGQYLAFVREEMTAAFAALTPKERACVVIAYEPLWAIGKTAESAIGPNDLTEMVLYIRKVLSELLPGKSASRALVLYGGSVEPGNIRDLARATGIDGFLIGHASVDERTFAALVKELS